MYFHVSVVSLPLRYYRFLTHFLPYCKARDKFVPRSLKSARASVLLPAVRGNALTLTLFHTSEVLGSQEKLDMAEVLLQQIPHPLQRIILQIKRVSCVSAVLKTVSAWEI